MNKFFPKTNLENQIVDEKVLRGHYLFTRTHAKLKIYNKEQTKYNSQS